TYIALGVMAFIPVFITLAVEFGRRPRDPQEQSFFAVATASGLNVPLAALTATSSFLLVIVVAAFAGAAVSEEANWGSLRYLLVRPVSCIRLRHVLITHYWDAWEGLFGRRQDTEDLIQGFLLQLPYIFVFLALSWWWFHRRDILS